MKTRNELKRLPPDCDREPACKAPAFSLNRGLPCTSDLSSFIIFKTIKNKLRIQKNPGQKRSFFDVFSNRDRLYEASINNIHIHRTDACTAFKGLDTGNYRGSLGFGSQTGFSDFGYWFVLVVGFFWIWISPILSGWFS